MKVNSKQHYTILLYLSLFDKLFVLLTADKLVVSRRVVTPCTEPRVVHVGQDPVQVESDLGEVGPAGWPGLLSKINFLLSLSFRFSYLRYVRPRISLKYHSSGSNG